MLDKDLKKLKREELLELLLEQSKEIDKLKEELAQAKQEAETHRFNINNAGSIAEASLKISEVFEKAQFAADTYLENVKYLTENETEIFRQKEAECKQKMDKMVRDTQIFCEQMKAKTAMQCKEELNAVRNQLDEKLKNLTNLL